MSTVIRFPNEKRALCHRGGVLNGSASIVILPVVRIQRHAEMDNDLVPAAKIGAGGRGRRRPAQPSSA